MNMKAYRYITITYLTMILIALVGNLSGCGALQPRTPSEVAFESTHSLTGFYRSIAMLREAKRITKEEARDLYVKADKAETALKTARISLEFSDKNTAQQNMLVANRLLLDIDTFLKSKEIEVLP